ncbi:hypothetical protein D3C71_1564800 [compost metagenome]
MAGSVLSCTRLLVEVVKVCAIAPSATSVTPKDHTLGMMAASVPATPNPPALAASSSNRGCSRPAASRAPTTEPTASAEDSAPYRWGPP